MMPSIMTMYNVSPETVVRIEDEREGYEVPDLGVKILTVPGLIPEALKGMRDKRLALKRLLRSIGKKETRYHSLRQRYKAVSKFLHRKAITDALKWLGVVCYGRLGFANATFGRVNSHEVVSYLARKNVLKARSIAASMGFEVLHVYVDSISVSRAGATTSEYQTLADKIAEETQLPMDFDGTIYPWFAFLATRENPNISVANRFYGVRADGEHKIRGIALRRSDTPGFVANIQRNILEILARETNPSKLPDRLPEILLMVEEKFTSLKKREVPREALVVTQTLSRELTSYSVLTSLSAAAQQLKAQGKTLKRGQLVRFIYTARAPGVHAWDLTTSLDPKDIDIAKYKELAFRAIFEVLQPIGIAESVLRSWVLNKASYVRPENLPSLVHQLEKQEAPIFAEVQHLHLDVV
jgi:DNA polymerase-2